MKKKALLVAAFVVALAIAQTQIKYQQTTGLQAVLGYIAENVAHKGQPSGYAPLDSSAKLPSSNLTPGVPVVQGVPTEGQMMKFTGGQWVPIQVRYSVSFTEQTSVQVPGSTHQLATTDLTVTCYGTDAEPAYIVEPDGWVVDPTTFDVTINFAVPQTGRCVLR